MTHIFGTIASSFQSFTFDSIASSISTTFPITLSSIPQTYNHLVVHISATQGTYLTAPFFRVNGDTASNYSSWYITADKANNATKVTQSGTGGFTYAPIINAVGASSYQSNSVIELINYRSTTMRKIGLFRSQTDSSSQVRYGYFRWDSTAAINSITVLDPNGYTSYNYATVSIYGVN